MKVVFVLPPYAYSRSMGNRRKRVQIGLLPPLGVGYLATALEAHGHTVALVDAVAEQLDVPQAVQAVVKHAPDVVGISAFTTLTPNDAYALANGLRERLPETPFVMGGPHVTAFADQVLEECAAVDVLVPGDGELVFTELVDRMASGDAYADLRGILYRDASGAIVATPPAEVVRDVDRFRPPARHIYKHELYEPLPSLSARRPVTSIITARGCPWARCRFCYQGGTYATPYRRRSPEDVVTEIKALVRDYGIRNLVVWDDNFCVRPKWIHRFCDLLDEEGIDIVWSILSRTDTVTEDMFARMARSGCYSVQFGIESGCPEILSMVNKGHTQEDCRRAVRWAKAAGLETRAFFILGFPRETPEMSMQTIRFACSLNMDYVVFFSYYLAPGTPLARQARKEGCCLPFESQQLPSYVPNTYPNPEALAAMVRRAYRVYYFRPAYIGRALWRMVKKPSILINHIRGFQYWLGLMLSR